MDQEHFIDRLAAAFDDDPAVRGLFLSGSFGRGTADLMSDIDIIAIVAPAHQPAFLFGWREAIEAIDPVVHWNERTMGALLVNAITTTWTRIDLTLLPAGLPSRAARDLLRPLIDRDHRWAALPDRLPPLAPDAAVVERLVAEFIRVLGLLVVVVTRGELVSAVSGAGMLRDMLVSLMMQQVALPDRSGALHLSTLLPQDRMRLLGSLPYPAPDRNAVIAAHLSLARAFFPIARDLAADLDLAWPAAFEEATRERLRHGLGIGAADLW